MRIIGLDTSMQTTGLCIWNDGSIEGLSFVEEREMRAEKMLTRLSHLLEEKNVTLAECDGIAVAVGPGSFTGLRIGVTVAKTLAQVLDIPLVGVSTLEAMAKAEEYEGWVVPVIDARGDRIYASVYGEGLALPENLYFEDIFLKRLKDMVQSECVTFVGAGILSHAALLELPGEVRTVTKGPGLSPVESICRLAQKRFEEGDTDSVLDLLPNYLRKSQAEMERERDK